MNIGALIALLVLIGIVIFLVKIGKIKFEKFDDTAKHVYAGMIITVLFGWLSFFFSVTIGIGASILVGFLIGNATGFGKEFIWDKALGKGVFNWQDILSTLWGTIVGSIILLIILTI